MADIDVAPEECEHCKSLHFTSRVIVRSNPELNYYIKSDSGLGWPGHGFYNKPYWPNEKK